MSTQSAAIIRKSLKSIGITSRQVSVRSGACSITCTIKDPTVKLDTVEAIASPHESVARDERTGGILAGGNTFVTVEYADEALAPIADRVLPQLIAIDEGNGYVRPKAFHGARHASRQIAIMLLNAA